MIPKHLKERAEPLGLKITRPKGRSGLFEVRPVHGPKDDAPIFMSYQTGVLAWLMGVEWEAGHWRKPE